MRTICPLCEATCGVRVDYAPDGACTVRGDEADPFSRGYICPKGVALAELANDPDRIREPMAREGNTWHTISWEEAFQRVAEGWQQIWDKYGRGAMGVYLGNPSSHNTALQLYGFPLFKLLQTPHFYTASTADQMPKHVAVGHMLGDAMSIPVPDLDRCDYLLLLGSNPVASNGSLMTAPDLPNRLKAIQKRGGKIVVVDPRRTETAKIADTHLSIRPGSDVYFLAALINVLFAEDRVAESHALNLCDGIDSLRNAVAPFTPQAVSARCGIDAETITELARELAEAPTAAIHGRMGTTTQDHGTITSWLIDVLHILTGNLDRPGGVMFTKAAHGPSNTKGESGQGKGFRTGRRKSRVRGYPEVMGEFPCGALAEEITTPGEGQIRGLFTVAGNPVLSTPDGATLDAALSQLEFMVSFDIYLNETTRHAHVILPDVTPLQRSHYDLIFSQLAIHNHARYVPPVEPVQGRPEGWEVLLRLAGIAAGLGPDIDLDMLDEQGVRQAIEREQKEPNSPIAGMDPDAIIAQLGARRGPERLLDFLLRTGPYGDGFRDGDDGLNLAQLESNPHGIDLGPLEPRLPEILRTPSGRISLAPAPFLEELATLDASGSTAPADGDLILIGRRHLRSNNSWMHNIPGLMTGKPRCTLMIHPDTAAAMGLREGQAVSATTDTGTVTLPVETTTDIMPGVVSIPHGWGHSADGIRLNVASAQPGVSANDLVSARRHDRFSGNAVLNGIPVKLAPEEAPATLESAVAAEMDDTSG